MKFPDVITLFNKFNTKVLLSKTLFNKVDITFIFDEFNSIDEVNNLLFERYNVKIEVLDKIDKNQDEELVEDLVQIITVFSCKIQGKRKTKTKQLIDDFSKKITELGD